MSTISRESSLLPEQQRSVQDDGWFDHLFGEDLKLRSEGHCSSLIYDYVCTSIKLLEAKNRELESKLERKLNQYPKVQTRSKKVKDENDESQETDHSTLLEAEVSNIAENIVSSSTAKRQSQLDLWRTSCKALLDELLFES
ncbi:hypothetical protein GNI_132560 [Gregarina niphandrodes]|uniref:Uncharacterized protein n=1 Tax=Gregarina niphandrodes TaxID=110365 RepID=A0A023B1X5_GRENI|nr:hypothetical protein GNI_132560 [Gregarina niphandrodes]EZG46949.1 hypothetical protein GNI_132560 [Gregarina niphandrodes]|eukprot:XP_011132224.1 hypothetical protein GNI_132560 [Gregarina niphandrodes]